MKKKFYNLGVRPYIASEHEFALLIKTKYRQIKKFLALSLSFFLFVMLLSDFINLIQVHNFTVSAQDVLPSFDFRCLP